MHADDREAAVNSIFEGILAAFNATRPEGNGAFDDCLTFAYAALASLEADGFTVIRNASRS